MGPTQLRSGSKRAQDPPRAGATLPPEHAASLQGPPRPGENFTSVVTAIRWTTVAASLLVLSTGTHTRSDAKAGAVVLAFALWRTVRPVEVSHLTRATAIGILSEAVVMVTAVVATGQWDSPYVLCIFTVVSLAGFSGGLQTALPTAAACVAAIALPYHLWTDLPVLSLSVQWSGETLLVAAVTGYARRITLQASEETSAFLGRLQQLSEANSLLLQLHRVATTLPMSIDLGETLETGADRLRDLFEPDVMVILLRDEQANWTVVRSSGVSLGSHLEDKDLPPVLADTSTLSEPQLLAYVGGSVGLGVASVSGICAPLRARDDLVGLVAVERGAGNPLDAHQLALMETFAEQFSVAIDNARWFSRIGTLAAERERSRIARDLHDSVGQSLALVGFELDRAAKSRTEDEVRRQLQELRETVRTVVAELRETLHDLRTDVSEEYGVSRALTDFLGWVGRRSALLITFQPEAPRRLPLAVEREICWIAREAVLNAERHSGATSLEVVWTTNDDGAVLSVTDDGKGMPSGDHRRPGGYGLLGMKERADAIGAVLTVTSAPEAGTEVRVTLSR